MRKKFLARPSLEQLEGRWVPATVRFYSGILQVTNPTGNLTITQTAANKFTVKDGSATIGTYGSVSNLYVTDSNAKHTTTIELGTFTYTGSLLVNANNGDDTINIQSTGGGGKLLGNTTILSGFGTDTVNIGAAGSTITFGGNITVTDTAGSDHIVFGNSSGVLRVGGSITLTGMNNIDLVSDKANVIGGNFTATLGADVGFLDFEQITNVSSPYPVTTVGGSVTMVGGPQDDFLLFSAITINKNLNINLKEAPASPLFNGVEISSSPSNPNLAITTVNGNFTYTGGSGLDILDLADGVFLGNVTLNMGNSPPSPTPAPGLSFVDSVFLDNFNATTMIFGTLTVYAQGDITFNESGFGIQATIGGDARFYLGNGDAEIPFTTGGTVGGKIIMRTGNGNNVISFNDATVYVLDIILGNGNDNVTFGAGSTISGLLDGRGGTNTLTDNGATYVSFTLLNF